MVPRIRNMRSYPNTGLMPTILKGKNCDFSINFQIILSPFLTVILNNTYFCSFPTHTHYKSKLLLWFYVHVGNQSRVCFINFPLKILKNTGVFLSPQLGFLSLWLFHNRFSVYSCPKCLPLDSLPRVCNSNSQANAVLCLTAFWKATTVHLFFKDIRKYFCFYSIVCKLFH